MRGLGAGTIWLGGSDALQEAKWVWGAGAEGGMTFSLGNFAYLGAYTNWAGSQPSNTGGTEHYLGMLAAGTWDDLAASATVGGYVIEWTGENVLANPQIFKPDEGQPAGYTLTTALGVNPELGETLTYSITGGNTGGMFTIDSSTGVISTTAELDYETVATYNLVIRVTDSEIGRASCRERV